MPETATSPELVMQQFFTRVFGPAIAGSIIGKQVQVSFDPAGYDQWLDHLDSYSHVYLTTDDLQIPRRPHCSVGIVSGYDYRLTPDPHLTLVSTIGSIAGIQIKSIEWHRVSYSSDERRWMAYFWLTHAEGNQRRHIIPILLKIID